MKIFHISDFHFKESARDKSKVIAQALLKSIGNERSEADLLIFTGDLVFSGKEYKDFEEAYKLLILRVAHALNLNKEQIFFAAGNHEVDRSIISNSIKRNVRSFTGIEEIDEFVDSSDFNIGIKAFENYNKFVNDFYSEGIKNGVDLVSDIYTAHKRVINNQNIGVVSINSAWCSFDDNDSGNLLFPLSKILEAYDFINDCDCKILLVHHPWVDFKEFNRDELENFVMSNFLLQFSGHLHKRKDTVTLTYSEGIFCSHSFASLVSKEEGKIGYSVLDINLEENTVTPHKFKFDFEENIFLKLPDKTVSLPHDNEKKEQIKLLNVIKQRANDFILRANSHFVGNPLVGESDFSLLFSDLPIFDESNLEIQKSATPGKRITYDNIRDTKTSYIIFGKDKCGKTALLYKINIDLLKKFSTNRIFPFYIDTSSIKPTGKYDFVKEVANFLQTTRNKAINFLGSHKIKILIDNYSSDNEFVIKDIFKSVENHNSISLVLMSRQTVLTSFDQNNLGLDNVTPLYIHDIKRKEIRQLTEKWNNIQDSDKELIINKIHTIFKQYNIPFNYWAVSVFLWIFSVNRNLNYHNHSELIEVYIDNLLDKSSLATNTRKTFSFLNYKEFLAFLAFHLLSKREENHRISYSELVAIADNFLKQNIRIVGNTQDIVQYLIDKGVLLKYEDEKYSFRLNGVFEYFLAYYLKDNTDVLNNIIESETLYLSFKNEFDLYSGFDLTKSTSKNFLETIFKKTQLKFEEFNEKYKDQPLDTMLNTLMVDDNQLNKLLTITDGIENTKPLSTEDRDDVLDTLNYPNSYSNTSNGQGEVQKKILTDSTEESFESFESHLFILARVYRNSYKVSDEDFNEKVLSFIIASTANLIFEFIEDIKRKKEGIEEPQDRFDELLIKLFDLIRSHIPLVIQTFLNESLGHVNLINTIDKRIQLLSENPDENQLELFILFFLKVDLDPKRYYSQLDILLPLVKSKGILNSMLPKLLYYHFLINDGEGKFDNYLKRTIKSVRSKISPNYDKQKFDTALEVKKERIQLMRRIKDDD